MKELPITEDLCKRLCRRLSHIIAALPPVRATSSYIFYFYFFLILSPIFLFLPTFLLLIFISQFVHSQTQRGGAPTLLHFSSRAQQVELIISNISQLLAAPGGGNSVLLTGSKEGNDKGEEPVPHRIGVTLVDDQRVGIPVTTVNNNHPNTSSPPLDQLLHQLHQMDQLYDQTHNLWRQLNQMHQQSQQWPLNQRQQLHQINQEDMQKLQQECKQTFQQTLNLWQQVNQMYQQKQQPHSSCTPINNVKKRNATMPLYLPSLTPCSERLVIFQQVAIDR